MSFIDGLVKKKVINKEDASQIREEVGSDNIEIENSLIKKGVPKEKVLEAKKDFFNIPTKTVKSDGVPFDVLKLIPEDAVNHYKFIPIGLQNDILEVGIVNLDNIAAARDALQFISSKNKLLYKIFLISSEDFEKLHKTYKSLHGEVSKALTELETELSEDIAEAKEKAPKKKQQIVKTKITEDAPVTKIVATILRHATEERASDIHIEPLDKEVRVRFRVDGVLHTSLVLPKKVHEAVVARIKVLSNMRLDEKRKPQDGRFPAHLDGRKIDFRVSTFPTFYGEKVVMRLLDSEKGIINIDKIGLSKRNLKLIREAIKRPYGLILISGPTGSGKTTTLYSMLQEIDRDTKNVLSLEDPIEYNIEGMNQSQVRPEIGYTFANGLRTTLRQDPDIIMVGEIRDKETAGLAVQAALTGHLVLSTIHTNNASGVIPRLIDMDVDPFLIAPTLILAMAQRLVQKLCPDTGKAIPVEGSLKMTIEKQFEDLPEKYRKEVSAIKNVYEIEPNATCPSGTRGRMAVMEVLEMTDELENTILKNPTDIDIMARAREQGMLTMLEDAIIKSSQKLIPFSEVNKLKTGSDEVATNYEEEEVKEK